MFLVSLDAINMCMKIAEKFLPIKNILVKILLMCLEPNFHLYRTKLINIKHSNVYETTFYSFN